MEESEALANVLRPKVGHQRLGNGDRSVRLLVLLQERDVESGKCSPGSIDGVAKAVLSFAVLEAKLHAPRLVVGEVRTAGHFEILAVSGGPHFNVVGARGTKAEISTTQFDHAIMQTEKLKNFLGVAGQFFEGFEGFVRMEDLNELHLVELVHADNAAIVPSGASCFATPTRSVTGHLDRKILLGEESVPVKIGDRDLGGGDEKQFVVLSGIDFFRELGELARAESALPFHDVGNSHFFVAMLAGLRVQEELNERALETGAESPIDRKSTSRNPDSVFEGDQPVLFRERDMILGVRDLALLAPGSELGIGLFVFALRTGVVWEVRDVEQEFDLTRFGRGSLLVERLDAIPDLLHLRFNCGTVFTLGAEFTDLPGSLFALGLELLLFSLGSATGLVAGNDLVNHVGRAVVTSGQTFFDSGGIFANGADIDHSFAGGMRTMNSARFHAKSFEGSPRVTCEISLLELCHCPFESYQRGEMKTKITRTSLFCIKTNDNQPLSNVPFDNKFGKLT